jgi:hypothetical protein
MDLTYIKAARRLRDKMVSPSSPSLISLQRNIWPDLDRLAMAILRSSHKTGKINPQAKSFKELVSRLGQRSQLAAPKYADNTKLAILQVWERWTKYVYSSILHPCSSLCAEANRHDQILPGGLRRVRSPHSSQPRRSLQEPHILRSRQVIFRVELSEIEFYKVFIHLHLC